MKASSPGNMGEITSRKEGIVFFWEFLFLG